MNGRGLLYYFKFTAIVLFLIISGCVSEPPPAEPQTTPAATPAEGVRVLTAPVFAEAGSSFEVTWRVVSLVEKNIIHTAVHYGPEHNSEPLTLQSYPDLTTPQMGLIPADFRASMTINRTGVTYFRAHAIIDGVDYWSDERTITVTGPPTIVPSGTPAIRVTSYPGSVTGEKDFTIQWELSGGTPGDISSTSVLWGYRSGGTNISDYPRVSSVQTGKTPGVFSAVLKAPASGTIYFRAHAIVDGSDLFSPEYLITIISPYTGGGY